MADDIQWTEADGFPLAGTYVGPQAVLEGVFMRLGEIGDDFAVVPEQFVAVAFQQHVDTLRVRELS